MYRQKSPLGRTSQANSYKEVNRCTLDVTEAKWFHEAQADKLHCLSRFCSLVLFLFRHVCVLFLHVSGDKRQVYDQYGHEGLQDGGRGGSSGFHGFHFRTAHDLFRWVRTSSFAPAPCQSHS